MILQNANITDWVFSMFNLQFSHQNIINGQGFELAVAGMIIVFVVLATVSLFITLMPKILDKINPYLPEHKHRNVETPIAGINSDDKATIAAICYVFHQYTESKK